MDRTGCSTLDETERSCVGAASDEHTPLTASCHISSNDIGLLLDDPDKCSTNSHDSTVNRCHCGKKIALLGIMVALFFLTGGLLLMYWLWWKPVPLANSLTALPSTADDEQQLERQLHSNAAQFLYNDGIHPPIRVEGFYDSQSNLSVSFNGEELRISKQSLRVMHIQFGNSSRYTLDYQGEVCSMEEDDDSGKNDSGGSGEPSERDTQARDAVRCGEAAARKLKESVASSSVMQQLPRVAAAVAVQVGPASPGSFAQLLQLLALPLIESRQLGTLTLREYREANSAVHTIQQQKTTQVAGTIQDTTRAPSPPPPELPHESIPLSKSGSKDGVGSCSSGRRFKQQGGSSSEMESAASSSVCPSNQCNQSEPYPFCSNECFGRCGPNCDCWKAVCGDCDCHLGCETHDYYCSCKGLWHPFCFSFASFWFEPFNPCSKCRGPGRTF